MYKINVDELEGNEVLAYHILSNNGTELMSKGTIIKKEYIKKLKELEIKYIYITDEENVDWGTDEKICKEAKEHVKNILETHIYKNTSDIEKMCEIADEIILDIMNEEKIAEQIVSIRRKGGDLYSHSVNVCALATLLGIKNDCNEEQLKEIARGALLHDIGLRYISSEYEDIDIEDMTLAERHEFKKHPIYGYDSVKDADWLGDIARAIILMHHETMDGKGYPMGYKRTELDKYVQIVSACDTFDEMITGIGYKKRKNYEAIEYIRDNIITKYNRYYVNQLLSFAAMYPVGTSVILSDGSNGIVKEQNKGYIDRPIVSILDENNDIVNQVDLTEKLTLFIEQVKI